MVSGCYICQEEIRVEPNEPLIFRSSAQMRLSITSGYDDTAARAICDRY